MKISFLYVTIVLVLLTLFASCKIIKDVKNAPVQQPYIYKNELKIINNNLAFDKKKQIQENLQKYWHDSLQAHWVRSFFVRRILVNPPVFNQEFVEKSKLFMQDYLHSQSFFRATIKDSIFIDSLDKKTFVYFTVDVQKPTVIDSVSYSFTSDSLQQFMKAFREASDNLKNKYLSRTLIAEELNKLVKLFRNKGYYHFSINNLLVEIDTVHMTKKAIDDTTAFNANIHIKERVATQASHATSDYTRLFKVGKIHYFPHTQFTDNIDSVLFYKKSFKHIDSVGAEGNFIVYQKRNAIKPTIFQKFNYLQPNSIYNDDDYYKTLNVLDNISAWQQVEVKSNIRNNYIDFNYFLIPAPQYNVTVDIETTRNTGDYVVGNDLLGVALNLNFRNRNTFKRAILTNSVIRLGSELNLVGSKTVDNHFLQTLQVGVGQSFVFPHFVLPFPYDLEKKLSSIKTVLNINANYTSRRDYFRLKNMNLNWGYEWQNKNSTWQYRPLNIEFYALDTLALLKSALTKNPYLAKSFNTGTVLSQQLHWRYSLTNPDAKEVHYFRLGMEEAGGLWGLIKPIQNQIFRYFRLETEYIKHWHFFQTVLATRALAGIGYNYNDKDKYGNTLPFFKQFIAGGPNSMRAWSLRQLGLGSSIVSDTSSTFRDRYGDLQLELNLEYRFPMFKLGSMKVHGAVFTDVGNIWNLHPNKSNPNEVFAWNRLVKDIAIAVGSGLRFDFQYFLLRVDAGIKLKDPTRIANDGWLDFTNFTWENNEYPVEKSILTNSVLPRNNYAIQLGIGLPF